MYGRRVIGLLGALALMAAVLTANALLSKPVVPDVSLTSIEGESLRFADLRGQVVLVNFWATSCVTCVLEMPEIAATQRRFAGRGYRTLAVAMQYDRPDRVIDYNERNRLPFPIVLDLQGDIARAFDDTGVTPTTFLIDTQGRIVRRYVGAPNFAELQRHIENLLAS